MLSTFKSHCRHFHRNAVYLKNSKIHLEDIFDPHQAVKTVSKELLYKPFAEWIEDRRSEAKRTLMIQVKSHESAEDLLNYCTARFGAVKSMHFHRNTDSQVFPDFFLVEFESKNSLETALSDGASHRKDMGSQPIPITSPFLWFSGKKELGSSSGFKPMNDTRVFLTPGGKKTDDELEQILLTCQSVDEQMIALHHETRITNLSTRLRFLACEQLELAMSGMFPRGRVMPFGSSVNSFGKRDADLDMVYDLELENREAESRLWFHVKVNKTGGLRMLKRRYCDQMANVIQQMLPGCLDVQNVVKARVPIVKYRQQFLGLECDLCTSMTGYYMSELLYLYGELDTRVRPLVFTIRKWARTQGLIIDARPTPLFTNFTLTLMVIFFLQFRYQMLPTFQELQHRARRQDHLVCESDIDCTFLRDISGHQREFNCQWDNQPHLDPGKLSLTQVLTDFFDFYSNFDFKRKAICVVSGEPQPKRADNTTNTLEGKVSYYMDVTNPLERNLNVASNIQQQAVSLFQSKCRESLRKMYVLDKNEVEITTSQLSYIISGKTLKLGVSMKELSQLPVEAGAPDTSETGSRKSKPTMSHEDRRSQEMVKKRNLRLPKLTDLKGHL